MGADGPGAGGPDHQGQASLRVPVGAVHPRRLAVKSQEVVHPGRLCDVGGCESTIPVEKDARMDSHQNARTTPRSRAAIVERVTKRHESVRAVAEAVGVCPKTVRKWVARANPVQVPNSHGMSRKVLGW